MKTALPLVLFYHGLLVSGGIPQTLKELNIQQAVNNLTDVEIKDRDLFWNVRFTVETIEHSLYQFDEFKSKKADAISLQEIIF